MLDARQTLELIGVPYNSAGRPGGVASAPGALRAAGLTRTLRRSGELTDHADLELRPPPDATRGPSGLLAETSLAEMIGAVHDRTTTALSTGRFPLLIGGDCPVLLGGLTAVRERAGSVGVLFVDGHEDAWPPASSLTGEAADCELGLALGRHTTDLPSALAEKLPLLSPAAVIALGPRDEQDLAGEGIESLDEQVSLTRPESLHSAYATGSLSTWTRRQTAHLQTVTPNWWLHVDLDVLATDQLSAVDYPQPGGLSWAELDVITVAALASPGCVGWSVCIYNPDLDPDRSGARAILGYLDRSLSASTGQAATAAGDPQL